MTSANGTKAAEELEPVATAPQPEPTGELEAPALEVQPMDYWREMTQRQVERLLRELAALEAQKAPLVQQLAVLQAALRGVEGKAPVQYTHGGDRRGPGYNPNDPKNKGENISEEQRALVGQMVAKGSDTTEVRAAMPNVKSGQVYSAIYNERQKLLKEAKPR